MGGELWGVMLFWSGNGRIPAEGDNRALSLFAHSAVSELVISEVLYHWRASTHTAGPFVFGISGLLKIAKGRGQMETQQFDLVVRAPMPSFFLQGLAPKTSSTTRHFSLTDSSDFN